LPESGAPSVRPGDQHLSGADVPTRWKELLLDPGPPGRPRMVRWIAAGAIAGAAVGLRLLLDPWMGPRQPFVFVHIAAVIMTLVAGWRVAAVAAAPALLLCELIAREPSELSTLAAAAIVPGTAVCAAIIGLAEVVRRLRARPRGSHAFAGIEQGTMRGLRRSNRLLRLLVQASEDLLSKDDPREFLDAASRRLAEQLGLEVYFHFALEPDGRHLSLASSKGVSTEDAARVSRIDVSEAICGVPAVTRAPVVLPDVQASNDQRTGYMKELGIRAYVCHPLVARGRVVGTLAFGTRGRTVLDADTVALLRAVCDQAAIVLDRWRSEEALRASEERYRAFISQSTEGIWRFELDEPLPPDLPEDEQIRVAFRHTYLAECNAAMARQYGYDRPEEIIGRPLGDFLPEHESSTRDYLHRFVRRGYRLEDAESREVDRHGNVRFFLNNMVGILDERGRLLRVWGTQRDVTERRRVEAAVREAAERLRAIVDTAADGIVTIDENGTIESANPAMQRIIGYAPEELVGGDLGMLMPEPQRAAYAAWRAGRREGNGRRIIGVEREVRGLRKDGTEFPLELAVSEMRLEGRTLYTGIVRDITARKESEERSRALSEATFDAILMHEDGVAIDVNDSFTRMFGYSREEVIGRDAVRLLFDPSSYADVIRRIAARGEETYEATLRRKDGSSLIGEIRSRNITFRGRPVRVTSCRDITAKRLAQRELARHRDHLQEILRERTAALEESYEKLRLSERLAGLGTLAAGLGHDMGNLLLPLRARLESIEAQEVPEGVREDVAAIRKAAEYLQRLTHGLRLLALDPDEASGAGTDLHDWWPDAAPLLRNALPRTIALEHRFAPGPLGVALSRSGLTQAIFNLVQNAGQALRDRPDGRVTIWAEPVRAPSRGGDNGLASAEPGASGESAAATRGFVRVGVTDNGPGMTPEVARRCLDPFFTTKARTHATGIGLALVHATAQRVGGSIEVHTRPGMGATFIMNLPAAGRIGPPRDLPVSAIEVGDLRLRSFLLSLVHAADFRVVETVPAEGACLWIVDREHFAHEKAARFVAAHPENRIIVVGAPPDGPLPERVVVLGSAPKPAAMRSAIREAAHACKAAPPGGHASAVG